MEVILRDHVDHVGKRGDVVKVADGYARNYLLPRKLALPATDANKNWIARERKIAEAREGEERVAAEALADRLVALDLQIARKVGDNDTMYGSVTNADIAEGLTAMGLGVAKAQVRMPNGPIKTVGDSSVNVELHTDVVVEINVTVYGETA